MGSMIQLLSAVVLILVAGRISISHGEQENQELNTGATVNVGNPSTTVRGRGASETADLVFLDGNVHTNESGAQQAVAIAKNRIVFVGSNTEAREFIDDATLVIDLQGRMLLPGFHDLHTHPLKAGIMNRLECRLPFRATLQQAADSVGRCATALQPGEWIRGGQWAGELLVAENEMDKAILDRVAPDNPVFLWDEGLHNAWLNSAALDALGIDSATSNPTAGTIVSAAETGEPTGLLLEQAAQHYSQHLPQWTAEQSADALQWALQTLNSFGITTIKDAATDEASLGAYYSIDRDIGLTANVYGALVWKSAWSDSVSRQIQLVKDRAQYRSLRFHPDHVKIFLDGVPESRTSVFLRPYANPGKDRSERFKGRFAFDIDELAQDVIAFDKQGLSVMMHTGGDGSVRAALNAVQKAREANGDTGPWHEIAHAVWIDPVDLPRFRALRVAANASPFLWYPGPHVASIEAVLGKERATRFHPFASLTRNGALIVAGSDWPAGVAWPNPWPLIESMVTRKDPTGESPGEQWPEERISLDAAIAIYTTNAAQALGRSHVTGSIAVGYSADIIVVDQNLFKVEPDSIGNTKVLLTMAAGKVVFIDARFAEGIENISGNPPPRLRHESDRSRPGGRQP